MQNNRAAWILLAAVTLKSHNRDADMLTVGSGLKANGTERNVQFVCVCVRAKER